MSSSQNRILESTISGHVKAASYAVRGAIAARAMELRDQIAANQGNLPFSQVINCNIGNPQQLDQKPLSFVRDVLSLMVNPALKSRCQFNADVERRAAKYFQTIKGLGAYSDSQGIAAVRSEVAQFLKERDGHEANPQNIFLTNGASDGVKFSMQTFNRPKSSGFNDGMLTPIPQYPLYSALNTLMDGNLVPYYLDESKDWGCTVQSLQEALDKATAEGITVRTLVVINPGNPTGQLMSLESMQGIINWCRTNQVCLLADEVYQENIWKAGAKFVSFRKAAMDMNAFDGENSLQLVSFHSISKGFIGECGLRGGYFEMLGFEDSVRAEILKLASINLCPNVTGQIAVGLMVQPPKPGDESYETYKAERDAILSSMQRRAVSLTAALNNMPGVECNAIDGAMYAFPSLVIPKKACDAAAAQGVQPDAYYCMELLNATGIVVVPGSGFGQKEGTFHFRTTILPPEDKMEEVVRLMNAFHADFMKKFE